MISATLKGASAMRSEGIIEERASNKPGGATRMLGNHEQSFRADWQALLRKPEQAGSERPSEGRAVNSAELLSEWQSHTKEAMADPLPPNSGHAEHRRISNRNPAKGMGKGKPKAATQALSVDPETAAVIASMAGPQTAIVLQQRLEHTPVKPEGTTPLARPTGDYVLFQGAGAPSAPSTGIHNRLWQVLREEVAEVTEPEGVADAAPQLHDSLSIRESGEQLHTANTAISSTGGDATVQTAPPEAPSAPQAGSGEGSTATLADTAKANSNFHPKGNDVHDERRLRVDPSPDIASSAGAHSEPAHPARSQTGAHAPNLPSSLAAAPAPVFDHLLAGHGTALETPKGTPNTGTHSIGSTPDPQQTFTALDSGSRDDPANGRWLHAGRTTAEAGFDDPSLGWIRVRAELGPSGVHASVVPDSAEAAQSLGAHLSGLSSFLTEHRAPVETLTVSTPQNQWNGQSMGQGGQAGAEQGADRRESFQRQGRNNGGALAADREMEISVNAVASAVPHIVPLGEVSISLIA